MSTGMATVKISLATWITTINARRQNSSQRHLPLAGTPCGRECLEDGELLLLFVGLEADIVQHSILLGIKVPGGYLTHEDIEVRPALDVAVLIEVSTKLRICRSISVDRCWGGRTPRSISTKDQGKCLLWGVWRTQLSLLLDNPIGLMQQPLELES